MIIIIVTIMVIIGIIIKAMYSKDVMEADWEED